MSDNLLSQISESRSKVKAAGEQVKTLIASLSRALTQLTGPWDRIAIQGTPVEIPPERYEGPNDRPSVDPWATPQQLAEALKDWRDAKHAQTLAYQAVPTNAKDTKTLVPPLEQHDL